MTVRIDRADRTAIDCTVMGRENRDLDASSRWADGRRRKRERLQGYRRRWWDAIVGRATGRGRR